MLWFLQIIHKSVTNKYFFQKNSTLCCSNMYPLITLIAASQIESAVSLCMRSFEKKRYKPNWQAFTTAWQKQISRNDHLISDRYF